MNSFIGSRSPGASVIFCVASHLDTFVMASISSGWVACSRVLRVKLAALMLRPVFPLEGLIVAMT